MEPIVRKRVGQVGSGAYSIYLPKKWIDAWPPEQQQERAVDLHRIDDALLVVPAVQVRRLETTIDADADVVARMLLSAYVRGFYEVILFPNEGEFPTHALTVARDVMRHTDERLHAIIAPNEIGYTLEAHLPPPFTTGADLMQVMAARVAEIVRLADDAIRSHRLDAERGLHAVRMIHDIQTDDVDRLWHQAVRLVANIELPLQGVTDFQLLDMTAGELHTLGRHAHEVAELIMDFHQLSSEHLDLPVNFLLKQRTDPGSPSPLSQAVTRIYRRPLEFVTENLAVAIEAIAKSDAATLYKVSDEANQLARGVQVQLAEAVASFWGAPEEARAGGLAAMQESQLANPVAGCLRALERLCARCAMLTNAQ